MLQNTQGIVLKTVKYSETSLIAKVYTEQFGIQSYMVNSVRSINARQKAAHWQSLSLLDMVVYHRQSKNIQHIKEVKLAFLFTQLPFDAHKRSIALLITEILYKTLQEETPNTIQFGFLWELIRYIDTTPDSVSNISIAFLLQWTSYIGFFPQDNFFYTDRAIFDLQEGIFTHRIPAHNLYLELPLSDLLHQFINTSITHSHSIHLNRNQRQLLLHALLKYYELHIENFGELRSLPILESLFG